MQTELNHLTRIANLEFEKRPYKSKTCILQSPYYIFRYVTVTVGVGEVTYATLVRRNGIRDFDSRLYLILWRLLLAILAYDFSPWSVR